ncbi:MAG: hypothetical protein WED09_07325 [Homoserinimonas sp.]
MIRSEMALLLAKVQLGDNRHVDGLVLDYWLDTIGDLELDVALEALKKFRRERPGTYLEPGHLLELSGVLDVPDRWDVPDVTDQVIEESRLRALEAAGVTEAEFEARKHDRAWVLSTFPVEQRQLTYGEDGESE